MPDDGSNVSTTDIDLVFLYRYATFIEDGVLDNSSQSPIYSGFNSMAVSGAFSSFVTREAGPGVSAPSSSGALSSGSFGELFHLPATPAQSGNASGIDVSSTQDFSFGGWFMSSFTSDFLDFMGKWAFGTNMRSYGLESRTGVSPAKYWSVEVGISNGSSTASVASPFESTENTWEHVVCTVDSAGTTDNIRLYISGVLAASGSATVSPGTSGAHPPFRIFSNTSSTSEGILNGVGGDGGKAAETFLIRRILTSGEVAGVYESGFISPPAVSSGILQSDINDTLKDNIGAQTASVSELRVTAWDANNAADPSGFRHMTSGYHPSWIGVVADDSASGLNFGNINQSTASGIKAITFRNITNNTAIGNLKFWMSDVSAFAGITGWEVSQHIDSKWLPNLTLPSGSGVVSRTLGDAATVLQSDGNTTISGGTLLGTSTSGESGISQYIYLSFVTNSDFTPSNYGPAGFVFRITTDNV